MAKKLEVYNSIEVLPLWNFFKVLETGDTKYLYIAKRHKYHNLQGEDLTDVWVEIYDVYANYEEQVKDGMETQNQVYYEYSQYLYELIMIKYLFHQTKVEYIKELRNRGYRLGGSTQSEYWKTLEGAKQRAGMHLSQMERLKAGMPKGEVQSNQYNKIVMWLSSNLGYTVDKDLTVLDYIEARKLVKQKINERGNT